MADSEARFARRLGFAVGRWDWWKLRDEHTPYEWALQLIADRVEPLGENRDDMRAARHTVQLLRAIHPEQYGNADMTSIASRLRFYLEFNQPDDDRVLTPEEAAKLKRGE